MLGGDLIDGTVSQVADALAPLGDLDAPLGVFAVRGNHEFISQEADAWMDHGETLGIDVLRNENVTLTLGSASIRMAASTTRPGADPTPPTSTEPSPTSPHRPSRCSPRTSPRPPSAAGTGVDLQLSGHTHGGQLWPFRYAVPLQQPVIDGLAAVGDVPVLTSRGAGAWGPPVRVLAPPEIPVITLRAG